MVIKDIGHTMVVHKESGVYLCIPRDRGNHKAYCADPEMEREPIRD